MADTFFPARVAPTFQATPALVNRVVALETVVVTGSVTLAPGAGHFVVTQRLTLGAESMHRLDAYVADEGVMKGECNGASVVASGAAGQIAVAPDDAGSPIALCTEASYVPNASRSVGATSVRIINRGSASADIAYTLRSVHKS